ncbi:loricrin-like [Camellia sinensis]|uniref:loricrin-like n=1 Tax=Camellia sinensis TaxID=4442 RepID=UPI00103617B9|nr:loricrin-like [Camellia sinensis]XP_028121537.1 loricrin-like [Camellia sinensis]XP_028121541.1 loricrin-like [Camellia sinensis]XP_028121544.1 loricrin-like [Camellia sinensis]
MEENHILGLSSYSMGAPTSKFFFVELKINFKGIEYMIENVLLKIDKGESVSMDAKEGKVTIKGSADPHHVIKELKKFLIEAVLVEKRPQMKQFAWGGCSGGGNAGGASPEQAPPVPRDFPLPKPPPGYNYVPSAPPLVIVGGSDSYHRGGGIDGCSGGRDSGDSDGHCGRGADDGSGGHGNSSSDGYRYHHGTDGRSGGYGGGRSGYRRCGTGGHDSGDSDGYCRCYRHGIDGGGELASGGHDMSNNCHGIGASFYLV